MATGTQTTGTVGKASKHLSGVDVPKWADLSAVGQLVFEREFAAFLTKLQAKALDYARKLGLDVNDPDLIQKVEDELAYLEERHDLSFLDPYANNSSLRGGLAHRCAALQGLFVALRPARFYDEIGREGFPEFMSAYLKLMSKYAPTAAVPVPAEELRGFSAVLREREKLEAFKDDAREKIAAIKRDVCATKHQSALC